MLMYSCIFNSISLYVSVLTSVLVLAARPATINRLTDQLIKRKLDGNDFDNICWFQLLKCEDLRLFFVIQTVNKESLRFGLLVGYFGTCDERFSQII